MSSSREACCTSAENSLRRMCGRHALYRPIASKMFRPLILAAGCVALGACAGVPRGRPVHDTGICVNAERGNGDLVTLQLCNCTDRPIRLAQSQVPWSSLGRSGFRLTFNRDLIPARDPGFADDPPFSFYNVPAGECLDGQINLDHSFVIGGRDLRAPGWALRWSGTIDGDLESWRLDFGCDF